MRATARLASGWLLALLVAPVAPAWAQTIEGTVLDDEWSVPIETAGVALVAANDSIVSEFITDERGRFAIRLPGAGSYRLRATRIGYKPAMSEVFELGPGQDALAHSTEPGSAGPARGHRRGPEFVLGSRRILSA